MPRIDRRSKVPTKPNDLLPHVLRELCRELNIPLQDEQEKKRVNEKGGR